MSTRSIHLYNTLSRQREELRPLLDGRVSMYSCGPTVYRYAHVGNMRTFMFPDLLARSLEYLGVQVDRVMNITDVGHLTDDSFDRGEDKMLVSARLEAKSPAEIAEYYTNAFLRDAAALNIRAAPRLPRATEYIPQMVELVSRLIESAHAYEVDGNVYYDISAFAGYGKLSGNTAANLRPGARSEVDPGKRSPGDFSLWKAAGEHRAQVWDSPWGPGFPGWHIECSAMSMALLGKRFDIHTGGVDNIFPHHEAEIAQSEAVTGHRVVNIWLHADHLMLSGTRMAKSAGNFVRITELSDGGVDPLAFRYLCLQAKYRTRMGFDMDGVRGADRALAQLRSRVASWQGGQGGPDPGYEDRFRTHLTDDLDLPGVMAMVAELVRSDVAPGRKADLLLAWDSVLGLGLMPPSASVELPPTAADLLARRERARAGRDFATADRLRAELAAIGVHVRDTAGGQEWTVGSAS